VKDVLYGLVGFVISGFQLAVGSVGGIGFVMEAAICKGPAQALVKEQEQEGDINTFGGEAVGVTAAIAIKQSVSFEFAQIVAELVEPVLFRRELEGGENCLVNLSCGPAADRTAVMQENFEEPDNPGVVDFDARITNRTDGDRQGDPLQQGKVHVDVEALCLEFGEAVGDDLEFFANGIEVIESFLQAEVAQVVGAEFVAQETGELFILLEEGVFPVRPENVMPVLDRSTTVASFPRSPLSSRTPKISLMRFAVSRHRPISQLRSNILWMGKWRLKMKFRQYSICEIE
jgi:hypothetical protein